MKTLATDKDYIIKPFNGGVKLARPNVANDGMTTFNDLMALTSDVCVIEQNAKAVYMNDPAVIRSGRASLKDCLGTTIFDVAKAETAHTITAHQKNTLRSKALQILEYDFHCKNDALVYRCLLFSMLWYRENNEYGGMLDLAIVSGRDNLAESLSKLTKLGLLNHTDHFSQLVKPHQLSKREIQCIESLTKGLTSKQIGLQLNLSPRTVDHYLESCMNKLNVATRAELVAEYLRRI